MTKQNIFFTILFIISTIFCFMTCNMWPYGQADYSYNGSMFSEIENLVPVFFYSLALFFLVKSIIPIAIQKCMIFVLEKVINKFA